MTKKKESLVLGPMLQKLASEIGASVLIEPEWRIAGQITFKDGTRRYFRYNTLDLNPVGASDIAKDKDYANFFLSGMGYPIVPGSKTFFSPQWANTIGAPHRSIECAHEHARSIGFPVIVKPNSGSQGSGVSLVHNKRELESALRLIFSQNDRVALVQKPVYGRDYRVVVLDDEVISAYERIPLNVTGDGTSSIRELLTAKQKMFERNNRDTIIHIDDDRMTAKLSKRGYDLSSIPAPGEQVFLLDNANLSTGGDSVDVIASIHPNFAALAINITRNMGLRLCGVDLMVEGDITQPPRDYWILEINAAPGLDHYAKGGAQQEQVVEDLYRKVLKRLSA